MKISLGQKYVDEPYGGGNEFIKNLKDALISDGHIVVDSLKDKDIDIVLLTNPLIDSELSTFNQHDINYYQNFKNKFAISLHRINECDERKNTNYVNKAIIKANEHIDSNIFVSEWIKNIYLEQGLSNKNSIVALGGPLKLNFNSMNKTPWNKKEKLKLVTHHWSGNKMKGSDLYRQIDFLCSTDEWKERIEFTYIGNLSNSINLTHTNLIKPLSHNELSSELKKHHVYVTGSINEPSGNHHMEGAMSGLPLLYNESGALPEYCKDYGISFNYSNFVEKLEEMFVSYDAYFQKIHTYPYSFENAYQEINRHFKTIEINKTKIQHQRIRQNKILVLFKFLLSKTVRYLYKLKIKLKIKLGKFKRILISND